VAHLSVFTIFERPLDYPEHYVVREFRIMGGQVAPQPECKLAKTLEEARRHVPPGRVRLSEQDPANPKVVESWI
jgi:hypothetical protein